MKHKNSHLLVGYWSRLRRGRAVPDQTDIDPRAIKRLLSHTLILDCASPARPLYRLAGTALFECFGFELKGTSFLAHWETKSALALPGLLRQALKLRQPLCLSSIAATADNGMVELETLLAPVAFNGAEPTRFFGLVELLGDPKRLAGRAIAYERLVASELIQEDEPAIGWDQESPLPLSPRPHPRAPYLKLVVSQENPTSGNASTRELIEKISDIIGRWHGAKREDHTGLV